MSSIRDVIYERLNGDAEFIAAFPGGFYKTWEVGEISRQRTPDAFDESGGFVGPCVLLKIDGIVPVLPERDRTRVLFTLVLVFLATDSERARAARLRAFDLLNDWHTADFWQSKWLFDTPEVEEEVLTKISEGVRTGGSRYEMYAPRRNV
jgi:hypothetical protein